jgi:hypothetical protein
MAANTVSLSSESNIFADRPVQTSTLDTDESIYKPADNDTYIDFNLQIYVRGQLVKADGAELDATDHTGA